MERESLGNVVVATDFTSEARIAVQRALGLPRTSGGHIDLLHVVERDTEKSAADRMLEEARRDAIELLERSGRTATEVVACARMGSPFAEIARHARASHAELVVVGRHGERRFRDALIGSTAERVIRHGDTSVLVTAGGSTAPYQRPLVATDMSACSRRALELAVRICAPAITAIDVLYVLSFPPRLHVSETRLVPALERRLTEVKRDAETQLGEFLASVDLGVKWNPSVDTGDPRAVILREALARNADLIALGTTGHTVLARVLLGSVAEGVIRAAPCDVLVARLPGEHEQRAVDYGTS